MYANNYAADKRYYLNILKMLITLNAITNFLNSQILTNFKDVIKIFNATLKLIILAKTIDEIILEV